MLQTLGRVIMRAGEKRTSFNNRPYAANFSRGAPDLPSPIVAREINSLSTSPL